MLPTGHIEFTWATLNLLQRKLGLFEQADYRWIAVAALAPDLLDKPLALTAYSGNDAALFWGHNLWLHAATWVGAQAWATRRGAGRSFASALPYLLAFSGHLIADRMWGFRETLFYPLGAGHWHPWVHVGTPSAMAQAYVDIIRTTPLLTAFEAAGLVALAWLVRDRRLWQRDRLKRFLRTGSFSSESSARQAEQRPTGKAAPCSERGRECA